MRGASFTIGFEIPHLGNDFFAQIVDGATGALHGTDYQLIIAPRTGKSGSQAVLESLVDRQVDGVIGIASDVDPEALRRLATDVPLVVIGRRDLGLGCDFITGDDAAGTSSVMDHLLALGHRRSTHLTIRSAHQDHSLAPRLDGYRRRMRRAGLVPKVVFAEGEGQAYEAAQALLRSGVRPTAIFAGYDTLAISALRAIAEVGAQSEISVAGYDGTELAAHPLISLTTVDQFGAEMGQGRRLTDGTDSWHPDHRRASPDRYRTPDPQLHSGRGRDRRTCLTEVTLEDIVWCVEPFQLR